MDHGKRCQVNVEIDPVGIVNVDWRDNMDSGGLTNGPSVNL